VTDVDVDQTTAGEVEEFDEDTRALLGELDGIANYLDGVDEKYERRSEIFLTLRARTPPVKHRILAVFAHSTEEAVIQALRKARSK
jgi:hypothetical protein